MRFLLSRRWILFGIAVGLLALLALRLGEWQFNRLEDREDSNRIVRKNLAAEAAPVAAVLAPGRPVDRSDEWRRVVAEGEYVEGETVIVRYRTRNGDSGVDVVVPLLTDSGTALLVDRGWAATGNVGTTRPDVPSPPPGRVRVVGYVRADATGDAAEVVAGSTRAISSEEIGPTLPFPVYGGFVDVASEHPEPAESLVRAETPDLGEGPHFFYGLQWWFFAALAIFGFGYLVWDEYRRTRRRPTAPADAGRDAGGDVPHRDATPVR